MTRRVCYGWDMTLPAAMRESLGILQSQLWLQTREFAPVEENVSRIVKALQQSGVAWAIIGAHAVNLYVRPRATVDLDVVIDGRYLKRVLGSLSDEFGEVTATDIGAALRISELALDIIRSDMQPVFRKAIDLAIDVDGVPVAPPELLIVLKYLAAVSPWRQAADRKQDAADLIRLVQTLGEDLDRDAAQRHAEGSFPGAPAQLAALFDQIDRGEDPTF